MFGQAGRSDASTFAAQQQAYSKVQRSVPRSRSHRESLAIFSEAKFNQRTGSGGGSLRANSTGLVAYEQRPNGTAAAAGSPGGTAAHAAEQGMATAVVLSAADHVTLCVWIGAVVVQRSRWHLVRGLSIAGSASHGTEVVRI